MVKVKEYTVEINNLPQAFEGFTILQVSDLHGKLYGNKQKDLLEIIHNLDFHMVAFTGDLDSKYRPNSEPGVELISGLKNKPIYFVPGNHDWATGYNFRESLVRMGVNILENRAEKFSLEGEHIWIVGVDDPYSGRAQLDKALENVSDHQPRILLAHAPEIYPVAIQQNIDLVLVGHTHGGQIRMPYLGALVVPGQGLLPDLDYGLYSNQATTMIINAGLGESVIPIRFNIQPELVLVKLKNRSK